MAEGAGRMVRVRVRERAIYRAVGSCLRFEMVRGGTRWILKLEREVGEEVLVLLVAR